MLSCFSRVRLFVTQWTVAHQAPLSMEYSRQEYWSGLPFPSPGDLPNPGIKPVSLALAGEFFTAEPPRKPPFWVYILLNKGQLMSLKYSCFADIIFIIYQCKSETLTESNFCFGYSPALPL